MKEWRSKSGSMFDMCNHCHTRPTAMLGEVGQLVWFHQAEVEGDPNKNVREQMTRGDIQQDTWCE